MKAGDRIRILVKGANGAMVEQGDEIRVVSVNHPFFDTEAPRLFYVKTTWTFHMDEEDIEWELIEP